MSATVKTKDKENITGDNNHYHHQPKTGSNGPANNASSGTGSAGHGKGSSGGATTHYEAHQYVGPYRLEKTLGKGQTGKEKPVFSIIKQVFFFNF